MYKIKTIATKPKPPKSKAIVGKPSIEQFRAIDPSRTPVSAYTVKQP